MALFYLFYRVLLSRDTFHRFNRIALLGLIALSVIIPFIEIVTEAPVVIQRPVQNLEYLMQLAHMQMQTETAGGAATLSIWVTVLLFVYIIGCGCFLLRFLYSAFLIIKLVNSGESTRQEEGTKLVVVRQPIAPFSWMKWIIISRIDLEESGAEILIHEKAHITLRHSYDTLLASLCVVFHWFNPAAWLLKQELQNIHEYEADESVLAHGVNARNYQLLLIKKAVGSQRFTSMANSFNHSKLKKRITMMLKEKSSPYGRFKFLYVLPLTAIAIVAFARPEISRELEKISAVKVIEKPALLQADTTAPPLKVFTQIKSAAVASDTVVVVGYGSMGDTNKEKKETVLKISGIEKQPLVFIDGDEVARSEMDKIDPNNIQSISVLKDAHGIEKYGEKAVNGVILIVTKNAKQSNPTDTTAYNRPILPGVTSHSTIKK